MTNSKPPFASETHAEDSPAYVAEQASVTKALERVRGESWFCGAGPHLELSLEIVLSEALNNVVEHSCAGLDDCWFRLSGTPDGQTVSVTIEDAGRPMPGSEAPEGIAPEIAVPRGELPEGGFGWLLIRSLCREVNYARVGSMNRLELTLQMT